MRELIALLIAGVGLCFLALELVSTGLQDSTSRTLRTLIRRSTKSRWSCAAVGVFAGGLMQSTSAVAVVLGSMATTGMVTLQQALPIVAFANVGTTALVFAGALDIRLAVLLAVGIAGIVFSVTGEFKMKAISSVVLGVALLLYGSDLITSAASDVERANWFSTFLRSWHGSTLMAFGLGTLASFLTQSTTTVALVAVALASAGQLNLGEASTMIYGANLGSTLMRILLTQGRTGILRQVSRFQDIFKIAGTAVFLSLFYLESASGAPLVQALVASITTSLPLQLATVNLVFNGSMAVLATMFSAPIERFVVATWPPSVADDLSAPKYVNIDATGDPETAIDLLEKEQMRVLKATRDYLTLVRPERTAPITYTAASLHFSFSVLFREIEHFYNAIVSRHVDAGTSGRLGNVHGREKLLELVEDSLFQLATSIEETHGGGKLEPLIDTFVEALDFLLMFSGDAARTLERGRAELVFDLSSDRGDMMAGLRSLHLAPENELRPDEKALLLRLTNLFERIVWMVQRYADLLLKNVDALEGRNGDA
jgi:phosphate:Na+ symporter